MWLSLKYCFSRAESEYGWDYQHDWVAPVLFVYHSKLRLNYLLPKIPKNCPRHDIKSGKTPRSGKAREGQKSGCFPASKGARDQRPHGSPVAKLWLNRIHLLTLKCFQMDPQTPKCIPGGSKSSFWCLIINNTTIWCLFPTEVIKFLLIKGVKIELQLK